MEQTPPYRGVGVMLRDHQPLCELIPYISEFDRATELKKTREKRIGPQKGASTPFTDAVFASRPPSAT